MVFSSTVFVFIFLPVALGVYFLLPRRLRNLWLVLVSIWFYAWGEIRFLPLILASTVLDYCCGILISGGWRRGEIPMLEPGGRRTARQRLGLLLSLAGNLGLLAVFKYFHFFNDNWNAIAAWAGMPGWEVHPAFTITLPLGISFYTFQTMSYTLDVYRGHTRATRHFINYCCFVTMFPQLVAGPIVRYVDVERELRERRETLEGFAAGASRFAVGLAKKLLIANACALPADRIFALPPEHLTTELAWIAVVCYTLQIYFDFSGYSDMAIGMGRMFGFNFPENFNYPYISRSITEFWRRWHISLSTWFRDYLYIPLGGNRHGTGRTYFNLVVVFFLCGLWHGAAWNFVFWGLYQGLFLCLERALSSRGGGSTRRVPAPLAHLYVLLVVMVGWVFFRAETIQHAYAMLFAMAGFSTSFGTLYNIQMFVDPELVVVVLAGIIGSMPVVPWLNARMAKWGEGRRRPAVATAWALGQASVVALLLLLSAMELSSATHNPFIYFRF